MRTVYACLLFAFTFCCFSFSAELPAAVAQPAKPGNARPPVQPAPSANSNQGTLTNAPATSVPAVKPQVQESMQADGIEMAPLKPDDVALSVNGTEIHWKDLLPIYQAAANAKPPTGRAPLTTEQQTIRLEHVLKASVETYVTAILLAQEAKRRGITPSHSERTAYIEEQKKEWARQGLDPDQQLAKFEHPQYALALSLDDTLNVVKLVDTVIDPSIHVSDEEIDAQINAMKKQNALFEGMNAPARKKAADAHKRAVAPGADFAALARENSEGAEAASGGKLKALRISDFPDFLAIPLQKMKVGDVSDVIETPVSIHILKLLDREGGAASAVPPKPADDNRKVTVAQIIFAKMRLLDIPDRAVAQMRLKAEKERVAVNKLAHELRGKAQISCPLFPALFAPSTSNAAKAGVEMHPMTNQPPAQVKP